MATERDNLIEQIVAEHFSTAGDTPIGRNFVRLAMRELAERLAQHINSRGGANCFAHSEEIRRVCGLAGKGAK